MNVLRDVAEKIVFQDAQSFHWNGILTSMERVEGHTARWLVATESF
jgi:hypothetical protein